jgi:hypothetical protein
LETFNEMEDFATADGETLDLHFEDTHRWSYIHTIPIDPPVTITRSTKKTGFLYHLDVSVVSNGKTKLKGTNKILCTGKKNINLTVGEVDSAYCRVNIVRGKLISIELFIGYFVKKEAHYDIHFQAVHIYPAWYVNKMISRLGLAAKQNEIQELLKRKENKEVDVRNLFQRVRYPPIKQRNELYKKLEFDEKNRPVTIDYSGTFRLNFEALDISGVKEECDGESFFFVDAKFRTEREEDSVTSIYMMEFPQERFERYSPPKVYQVVPEPHIVYYDQPIHVQDKGWKYTLFQMFTNSFFFGKQVPYKLTIIMGWVFTVVKAKRMMEETEMAAKALDEIVTELKCKPGGPDFLEAQNNFIESAAKSQL